jgi:hypothetical protein
MYKYLKENNTILFYNKRTAKIEKTIATFVVNNSIKSLNATLKAFLLKNFKNYDTNYIKTIVKIVLSETKSIKVAAAPSAATAEIVE